MFNNNGITWVTVDACAFHMNPEIINFVSFVWGWLMASKSCNEYN